MDISSLHALTVNEELGGLTWVREIYLACMYCYLVLSETTLCSCLVFTFPAGVLLSLMSYLLMVFEPSFTSCLMTTYMWQVYIYFMSWCKLLWCILSNALFLALYWHWLQANMLPFSLLVINWWHILSLIQYQVIIFLLSCFFALLWEAWGTNGQNCQLWSMVIFHLSFC